MHSYINASPRLTVSRMAILASLVWDSLVEVVESIPILEDRLRDELKLGQSQGEGTLN